MFLPVIDLSITDFSMVSIQHLSSKIQSADEYCSIFDELSAAVAIADVSHVPQTVSSEVWNPCTV